MPAYNAGMSSTELTSNLHSIIAQIQSVGNRPPIWDAQLSQLQDLNSHMEAEALAGLMMPWHTDAEQLGLHLTSFAEFMDQRDHARQVQQQHQQYQRHQQQHQLDLRHQHLRQQANLGELADICDMLQLVVRGLQFF